MNQDNTASRYKPYWASAPSNEIADEILDRVDRYYKYLTLSGRLDLYRRSWGYYYKPRLEGSRMNPVGTQGELTSISVNQYRNFLQHLETLTTQQRAAFEPRAVNSDVESQSQTILAAGLLDFYMSEKKLERILIQAVKDGLMFGEGFVRCEWDANAGKQYGTSPTGAAIYEGDMKYTNYTPFNCIRDFTQESAGNDDYFILRDFVNKHNLAAKFPDLADDILDDSTDMVEYLKTTTLNYLGSDESDNIAVYTLIHKSTPAMPQGRYTTCLDNGTVLMDGPLPYKETHVYRLAPDEESGTIFGYTVGFDLMPVQEAIDLLYSTGTSNFATFGVQNLQIPKGSDLSVSQLAGGMNAFEYDTKMGEIKPLQLTSNPPQLFDFIQMLEHVGEIISGVNSVARGNPEASLKSGAALALVQSMAVQFSMGLQRSYSQIVEDVGTGTINILKTYAAVPRVAEITGKSNRPLMKQFVGKDLGLISRVKVDMGNPLTNTTAGKVNLAESLMANNMIENPDQYIQVITTGRLEPVIQGKQAQLLLIKSENEGLSDGQAQRALLTDNHAQHIMEHSVVLASPEARAQPNGPVCAGTLAHIQEHMMLAQSPAYQMLAPMLGHQNLAPMQPAGAPPPQDGGTGNMLNGAPANSTAAVNPPNMPQPPVGTDAKSEEVIQQQTNQPPV